MGFDYLLFKGGLQAVGIAKQITHGNIWYKLKCYKDLDPLLGQNWHYRGANENGDYAFVILSSVEYYIHQRKRSLSTVSLSLHKILQHSIPKTVAMV